MEECIKQINKHKKAIAYVFFDTKNEVRLVSARIENKRKELKVLLEFEQDQKVIYKSGDLNIERGFQKYLAWFNNTINNRYKNYVKNILIYDECGFVEYIEDIEEQQIRSDEGYYYRYGSLIAIVLSINGEFLSLESVKRKGQYPVIQDIISVTKKDIKYTELLSTGEIYKRLEKLPLTRYEMEWVLQGYAANATYIRECSADIQELIGLCFEGG